MAKHIVMRATAEGSELTETPLATAAPIELPQADGTPAPLAGWKVRVVEDMGVTLLKLEVSEQAVEFPIHSSDDKWLAYVASGAGTLFSGSHSEQKGAGVAYQAGDYITFEASTPHGWISDAGGCELLFVKRDS